VALPPLADALHVFVFGPGTGELVAVRAPPNDWLIVDGCGVGRTKYGPALLAHYGASPRLLALTHPHRDHAVGVADIVDELTQGPVNTWPQIGLLWPTPRERIAMRDLQAYFRGGIVEDALSAIRDRWRRHPPCRWNLDVGTSTPLGTATITVLSPERGPRRDALRSWADGIAYDPNQIATVLEVAWRGHHVLLGSDLVEQPGGGWSAAALHCADVVIATKVPHHGSINALHTSWIRGGPTLMVTPFASSNLPRFDRPAVSRACSPPLTPSTSRHCLARTVGKGVAPPSASLVASSNDSAMPSSIHRFRAGPTATCSCRSPRTARRA
jgi:beta-lactamase superfamily II metal-dependent hydrolase